METPPQTPLKRKFEQESSANSKKQKELPIDVGERKPDDGSMPGGKCFSLMSTIPSQNIWTPFKITSSIHISMNNLVNGNGDPGYCQLGSTTSYRALFLAPQIIQYNHPILTNDAVFRFKSNKLRLSNLIMTNEVLNIESGTPTAATTFNSAPYVMIQRAMTGQNDIPTNAQFNNADDSTSISWTSSNYGQRRTYADISGEGAQTRKNHLWKQGDDAYEIEYTPMNVDVVLNENNLQFMPWGNYAGDNVSRGTSQNQRAFPYVRNDTYPAYVTMPFVPDANGSAVKFGCNFILEQEVTGYKLTNTYDDVGANTLTANVFNVDTFTIGPQLSYAADVRNLSAGSEHVTI